MNIKNLIIAIFSSFLSLTASAQEITADAKIIANEDSCSTEAIQSAIDACVLLSHSVEMNDTASLRKAKEAIRDCRFASFVSLRRQDKTEGESLNGHLVFNEAFADSLADGKDAYNSSDLINKRTIHRGQVAPGQILTKTILLKANGKSVYKFISRDRQELAVVAEPGGLVTTRVHAVNPTKGIDEWHNDTTEVSKGKNSRKTAFTLPHTPKTQVTLEITNCTGKDISVVVISN